MSDKSILYKLNTKYQNDKITHFILITPNKYLFN